MRSSAPEGSRGVPSRVPRALAAACRAVNPIVVRASVVLIGLTLYRNYDVGDRSLLL
jgi:hypothetical protein